MSALNEARARAQAADIPGLEELRQRLPAGPEVLGSLPARKERPILFAAPMVRALLAGTKTQTRRALRIQPPANTVQVSTWHHPSPRQMFYAWTRDGEPVADHATAGAEISDWPPAPCPYGQPGDRLRVKEAAWMWCERRPNGTTKTGRQKWLFVPMRETSVIYASDHPGKPALRVVSPDTGNQWGWRLKIGRFLPAWASRITLEVTGVRVERLQDISEADAIAEGIERSGECNWRDYMDHPHNDFTSARRSFRSLWSAINGPESWDANPWVWVVEFRRVSP